MNKQPRGAVLILVLWAVAFLTVLAVYLGVGVRQQLQFMARLEKRERLRLAAQSGVDKARAVVNCYFNEQNSFLSRKGKQALFHNPQLFQGIPLGRATVDVFYLFDGNGGMVENYGVMDEEGKLNVNTAETAELALLFQLVLGYSREAADDLARFVVDWRKPFSTQLEGFYSDQYYENLEFPYAPKRAAYERLDELKLVKGVTPEVYSKLKNFLTIYGSGQVNLNTASQPVLLALGMGANLSAKIIYARQGKDGVEGTADDFIFDPLTCNVAAFSSYIPLSAEEIPVLNTFFQSGKVGARSEYFRVNARARFAQDQAEKATLGEIKSIESVFQAKDGKIIYWQEE